MRNFKFGLVLSAVAVLVFGLVAPLSAQEETGALCVRVYADRDANGFFDSGERLVQGAIVKLSSPALDHPATYTTGIADTPECVDYLKPGLYAVSVRPPEGATATTPTELQIQVIAGEKLTVEVGLRTATSDSDYFADICGAAFSDLNGDGTRDEGERLVGGGTITAVDLSTGAAVGTLDLDGDAPVCFSRLVAGDYHVAATLPPGWKKTTQSDWELALAAGSTANLEFGAQPGSVETGQSEYPYNDPQFWLAVVLVIGMAVTPFIALASLVLNIIILRRLGRMQAEKAKAQTAEAP